MFFKRFLLCAMALCGSLTHLINAQSQIQRITVTLWYESSWNEVDKAEKASLPQTAAENVEKIYRQALVEKNSPELIKTLLYKLKYGLVVDKDRAPQLFSEIEQHTENAGDVVEQSMLYSVLSQLYYQYYQSQLYNINRRTALAGYVPEDIREWTTSNFMQRIAEYVDLSLQAEKKLQAVDVLKYEKILVTGEASRDLRPTVYDFLANEGIAVLTALSNPDSDSDWFFSQRKFSDNTCFALATDFVRMSLEAGTDDLTVQILKIYQNLLSFRLEQKKTDALLQVDLDRLEFVSSRMGYQKKNDSYISALENLEKQYEGQGVCVEILFKKASCYLEMRNSDGGVISPDPENREVKPDENLINAYQICNDGIRKYPGYKRIGLLVNLKNGLTQARVRVSTENNIYPGKSLKLSVNYQNVNKLTVGIYRMNIPATAYENVWDMSDKYREAGTLIDTKTFSLKNEFPYLSSDTTLEIPMKDLGGYEYVIYADDNKDEIANNYFSVSRLTSVARSYDNKYEFLVVDRMSGKPLEGAKVNLFKRNRDKNELQTSVVAGKDGLIVVPFDEKNRMDFYSVVLGNDTALMFSSVPWSSRYRIDTNSIPRLNILTDRSIYRPGQTVYFKGIAYSLQKDSAQISANQEYTLFLRDPNGQEIASKTLHTNEMGSFSGEFILPYGSVNGGFSISTSAYTGSASFQVEEYKRPAFDITFEPVKETYGFGDEIKLRGETCTFSGVNLQNTKVKYRIVQRYNWIWGWGRGSENQIAGGVVQTDSEGKFELTFLAEKEADDQWVKRLSYLYQVEVSVTDERGETQQSSIVVPVGTLSMQLTVPALDVPVDKNDLPEFIVYSKNLNEQLVDCKGSYEIYSLKEEQSLDKQKETGDLKTDQLIASGEFISGEKMNLDILKKTQSGRYRMIIKANDDKTREISEEIFFLLYSRNDKRPPATMYEWFLSPKLECRIGETTDIIYGSSAGNVYVLYDIFKEDKKIESSRFELNDNIKKIPVTFKKSYGDGIVASLTFVKDGNLFSRVFPIRKAKPKKDLELKMEVFRDKLVPGQKEEWKISVKDADKKSVDGEVLASMYDASLDKLYAHSWRFYPKMDVGLYYSYFNVGTDFGTNSGHIHFEMDSKNIPAFSFDTFNWFGLNMHGQTLLRAGSMQPVLGFAAVERSANVLSEIDQADLVVRKLSKTNANKLETLSEAQDVTAGEEVVEEPVQIRRNFNETAFFYPQLRTNVAGETLISFTVPESNTTWKLMALAHTKDLKFGQLIEKTVSRKKLMVSPNMPRFMRHGDQTTLTTAISNLSDETLSGKVSLSFFDPVTEKETIVISNAQKDFSVEAGKTTTAGWTFEAPAGIDLTACKIVATTNGFSDGEQHLLPVLPNRMLVTESLPLYISGKGNRQFTMSKPVNDKSASLKNHRLTLEFSSNPVWYAIQALPAMTTPASDDVISWFAAYYANNLAVKIANGTPAIKRVIDAWTKQGGTKESLLSNLEKNKELKAVLLEETPWLMEGKNETEQKQRLSLLFDVNRSANLNRDAVSKLRELQKEDGGWAWFKGMNSSVSISQWLLYGMAQLVEKQADTPDSEIVNMQKEAIGFIDFQFVKHFEDLKKYDKNWEKKNTISVYEAEYLLVRSLYPELSKEEKVAGAYDFYSRIASTNWAKCPDLYGRAIIALFLQQTGAQETAKAVVNSLRQHALQTEELGMYWPNNETQAFMSQSVTAVHTFIMEAFRKTGASEKEMNEMKLWLLKQKQTQQWESTPATVNAVSVLAQNGSNRLETGEQARISLGKTILKPDAEESGTGYVKQIFESQEITSDMMHVSISKPDQGPAWGALYWQYFEDLDKITKSKTGLNVEKLLFKEVISGSGKTLAPITENNALNVGDKVVVRLTVRSDRDMEYVLLKDMRAACFEPLEQVSGIRWKEQNIYYQTSKDASTNFYFHNLSKGTYVFEYQVYVTRTGEYSNGITTIQSLYAPEFVSNTEGLRVVVRN
ncbi:MAG: hypothetical protein LBJ72_04700 [Dysgonamonadaceae bacterium]|jgi:hypothetical protein|nr:hypothetical protein [Dysgonamonadaceae bacterium]